MSRIFTPLKKDAEIILWVEKCKKRVCRFKAPGSRYEKKNTQIHCTEREQGKIRLPKHLV